MGYNRVNKYDDILAIALTDKTDDIAKSTTPLTN